MVNAASRTVLVLKHTKPSSGETSTSMANAVWKTTVMSIVASDEIGTVVGST